MPRLMQHALLITVHCVLVCLFVFISSTMRFSRYGLGASYLATHNHSAIPELTLCKVMNREDRTL
jgi:hypothetical protein